MGVDTPRIGRRHRFLKAATVTLAVLVTVAIVAGALAWWMVTRSFPQVSGSLDVPGLHNSVTVYRDDAGIPQVIADDPHDLFLAQGYVHAQDRFWEMDFRRHVTGGTLSELFGESQVGTDSFIRTLGWREVAQQEVKAMDQKSLGYYQDYADGVNAYLKRHEGADISLEYAVLGLQNPGYKPARWTPVDSVSWLKAMAWDLRSNLTDEVGRALVAPTLTSTELAELYPEYPYDAHPTITDLGGGASTTTTAPGQPKPGTKKTAGESAGAPGAMDDGGVAAASALHADLAELKGTLASVPQLLGPNGPDIGSNSWVVSGAHTATGKPILSNDPHLGPAEPSVWYQMGLHCRSVGASCPFDVAGFGFSGMPGIIIGHNDHIAWGFTNAGPDVTDLYLEKVTGDTYLYDGKQVPLTTRKETIKVAGGKNVHLTVRSTAHGPIVTGGMPSFTAIADDASSEPDAPENGYQLSLQWTALTPGTTAVAVFALNAAHDWEQFREAARLFDVPSQNLIYADVKGNIGYQMPGMVPVRTGSDGTTPAPGWSSAYAWSGYVPFEQLPSVLNPTKGFIATANNAAVGPSFPVAITRDWDAGYRANEITWRLSKAIAAGHKLTVNDMARIQDDNHNQNADTLVPLLTRLTLTGDAKRGAELLRTWNRDDDADSAASAYFNVFFKNLLHLAFGRKLPDDAQPTGGDRWFNVVHRLSTQPESGWWSDENLGISGRDQMLAYAAKDAWKEASSLMGGDPNGWSWGEIHTLTLTNASFGTSGIGPIEALFNRGPFELSGGSAVVDATGWNASLGYEVTIVPSMRQVIDLADFDRSTWINLTGESGHAFHPNYIDQTPLWQHHKTRPWPFSPKAVIAAAKNTLTLNPPPR
ncbi:penicillin acylase family protein [Microbacterium sp. STN6]|uniref:penicillin acylase family protein n=1 Tax=Microbacterium sp. STN6 TaxID=2995588 RepID=UPI002260BD71|nr:penicillin acylase family protein [Microbacterium sp. STN6]MCX7521920.1 penicillin acylase family protein [Microbacterium sp. STN6]